MPKLFVNPVIGEDLRPLEYSSLEEAMEILENEIDDYVLFFENNPGANLVNVTFGELNKEEWDVFHKKQYIGWIASAKKVETRERRAKEALNLLKTKQKLGMK